MLFVGDVDGRRELRKNALRILRVVAVPRMSTAALAGSSEERRVWGAVGWIWFGLSESWRVGMVVCVLYSVPGFTPSPCYENENDILFVF